MRRSLLRGVFAFGFGIFATRLRWRPERNPSVTIDSRVRRSLLRGFELCECSESVIIVRLTADPMTFLRAIPCPAVAQRRRMFDVRSAFLFDENY